MNADKLATAFPDGAGRAVALQAVHQAPNLQSRVAEIQQQTNLEPCRLQVIQALCAMNPIQRLDRFQFDDQDILDHQIRDINADHHSIIEHLNRPLLPDVQTGLTKLMRQRVLIDLF
jgi:hypothetical protein